MGLTMKEKKSLTRRLFPLPENRMEREVGHSGRIHPDYRLQKPEIRPAYPEQTGDGGGRSRC
jgi:hypothetical protein